MFPLLSNMFMGGVMRQMKMRTHDKGTKLVINGKSWRVLTCLYVDNAVMFAENKQKLQKMANEFDKVCRRKLK